MKNSEHGSLEDIFGPVVSSYSRAQAIEDGVLIDVTSMPLGKKTPQWVE